MKLTKNVKKEIRGEISSRLIMLLIAAGGMRLMTIIWKWWWINSNDVLGALEMIGSTFLFFIFLAMSISIILMCIIPFTEEGPRGW